MRPSAQACLPTANPLQPSSLSPAHGTLPARSWGTGLPVCVSPFWSRGFMPRSEGAVLSAWAVTASYFCLTVLAQAVSLLGNPFTYQTLLILQRQFQIYFPCNPYSRHVLDDRPPRASRAYPVSLSIFISKYLWPHRAPGCGLTSLLKVIRDISFSSILNSVWKVCSSCNRRPQTHGLAHSQCSINISINYEL